METGARIIGARILCQGCFIVESKPSEYMVEDILRLDLDGATITRQTLVDLLRERFAAIDFKQAADEVRVFLPDSRELQLWSREFFDGLAVRFGAG